MAEKWNCRSACVNIFSELLLKNSGIVGQVDYAEIAEIAEILLSLPTKHSPPIIIFVHGTNP